MIHFGEQASQSAVLDFICKIVYMYVTVVTGLENTRIGLTDNNIASKSELPCDVRRQSDIKDTESSRREWSLSGSLTEQSVTSSCHRCKLPLQAAAASCCPSPALGELKYYFAEGGQRHYQSHNTIRIISW